MDHDSLSDDAKKRLAWFQYALDHNASIKEICEHFGISRTTFHRWATVFDPNNPHSLESLPTVPGARRQPETPRHIIERIRGLRQETPLMSKEAISETLTTEGVTISASTVGRVIQRHNLYFANTASHRLKRLRAEMESNKERSSAVASLQEGTNRTLRSSLEGHEDIPEANTGSGSILATVLLAVCTSALWLGGVQRVYALEGSVYQINSNFPNQAAQSPLQGAIFEMSGKEVTNLKKPLTGSQFEIVLPSVSSSSTSVSSASSTSQAPAESSGTTGTGGGRREETLQRYRNERDLHRAAFEQKPSQAIDTTQREVDIPQKITEPPQFVPTDRPKAQSQPVLEIPSLPTNIADAVRDAVNDVLPTLRTSSRKAGTGVLAFFEELQPAVCPEPEPILHAAPPSDESCTLSKRFVVLGILLFWLGVLVGALIMRIIDRSNTKNPRTPKRGNRKSNRALRIRMFAFLAFCTAVSMLWSTAHVHAITTAPLTHVYNGNLLSNGVAVTTAHTIRFSYWTSADFVSSDLTGTGAINTSASTYVGWYEEHTVTPNSDGAFSAVLGSNTPLPTLDSLPVSTLTSLHLQIEVKVSGAADSTYDLLDINASDTTDDRSPVLSVPFAQNADMLDQREIGTGSGSIPVLGSGGKLTLDNGSTQSGSVILEFGKTLTKQLSYNLPNARFEFDDDVHIDGTLTISGSTIATGTGAGTLRWTGSAFEGYNGSTWKKLDTGGGTFIGVTTLTSTGSISSGNKVGYEAANAICAAQYAGSHMCQVDEIITTIHYNINAFSGASNGWMAEGAPGFTSDSNDCKGWTSGSGAHLGAWWEFSTDGGSTIKSGGGEGFLTSCSTLQPIACCR